MKLQDMKLQDRKLQDMKMQDMKMTDQKWRQGQGVKWNAKSILSLFFLKRSPLVCSFVSCYFIPAFSCPAISCPANWSVNFTSVIFTSSIFSAPISSCTRAVLFYSRDRANVDTTSSAVAVIADRTAYSYRPLSGISVVNMTIWLFTVAKWSLLLMPVSF